MLRQYNEYLKEQMVKEAEDEAQYDDIRKQAEGRIWDQRDAQLKAQRDARAALMKQVSVGDRSIVMFVFIIAVFGVAVSAVVVLLFFRRRSLLLVAMCLVVSPLLLLRTAMFRWGGLFVASSSYM